MLLVLDNCEHVIEAAAALAVDTLRGAPGVRVLPPQRFRRMNIMASAVGRPAAHF